ncbi:MAG: DUF2065 domain-containing protein [Elioraea sp.]|nr:DUF2065 domain-containing protein [Elioraea sp.]
MTAVGLLAGVGLVLALEGLMYAAFPDAVRRALATLLELPEATLRGLGLAVAATGAALILLAGAL